MKANSFFDLERKSRQTRYFSEDFKRRKVRELEKNLTCIADICRTYEVSNTAVYKWIYTYSAMAKKKERQVVDSKSDTQKIKALQDRIRELERIVGQKQLLLEFKDKMIEIAENDYGVDIKKRVGSKLSSGNTSTDKNTEEK